MQVYKWSDSDVILYTVGIVAMLDVYYAAAVLRNKLGVVANCCCVWSFYTTQNTRINFA